MIKLFLFWIVIFLAQVGISQSSFWNKSDSINRVRTVSVASGIGVSWAAGTVGFYQVWYSNYPKSKFHTFDDSHNWLQMDKVGHFYTANKLCLLSSGLFEWSGISKKKATLIGAGIGLGLQTTLELMDGTSSEWGFSWSDMAANTLGVLSSASQELIWKEQRVIVKFSDHMTPYAAIRPNVLGSTFSERFLKDYNGQTYWLSFSPGTFMKSTKFPEWLCFSLGYSINQKLVGDQEVYFDPMTNITYHSQRQWLLSLDVDFSKLPIRRPWLKTIVKQLNYVKIPFPALMLSNGRLSGAGIYF